MVAMLKRSPHFLTLFSLIVLSGGVLGYIRAGSWVSLGAGILFFLSFLASALALYKKKALGAYLATFSSCFFFLTLLVRFFLTWKLFPAGVLLLLTLPVLVLSFYTLSRFPLEENVLKEEVIEL